MIVLTWAGVEYPAVVEYAPYQAVPKKKAKKDPKVATILEGVCSLLQFVTKWLTVWLQVAWSQARLQDM